MSTYLYNIYAGLQQKNKIVSFCVRIFIVMMNIIEVIYLQHWDL